MSNDDKFHAAELRTLTELAQAQAVYAERQSNMDNKLDDLKRDIQSIKNALIGDASDEGRPGLIVRLDRVEQKINNRDKLLWVLMTAVVSISISRLFGVW